MQAYFIIASLCFALIVAAPVPEAEDLEGRQLGGLASALPGAGASVGPLAGMLNVANPFSQATGPLSQAFDSMSPLMDVMGPLQTALQGINPGSAGGLASALPNAGALSSALPF